MPVYSEAKILEFFKETLKAAQSELASLKNKETEIVLLYEKQKQFLEQSIQDY